MQKAELGRYAHEDKMPDKLVNLLRKGRYISSEGMYAFRCRPKRIKSRNDYTFSPHH